MFTFYMHSNINTLAVGILQKVKKQRDRDVTNIYMWREREGGKERERER